MGGKHRMKHLIPIMVILLLVSTSFVGISYNVEKASNTSYDGKTLYVGGSLAYGLCDDPYDELDGIVVFDPDDPENLTLIKQGTGYVSSGGCFVPPHYMYFTKHYNGVLCSVHYSIL